MGVGQQVAEQIREKDVPPGTCAAIVQLDGQIQLVGNDADCDLAEEILSGPVRYCVDEDFTPS